MFLHAWGARRSAEEEEASLAAAVVHPVHPAFSTTPGVHPTRELARCVRRTIRARSVPTARTRLAARDDAQWQPPSREDLFRRFVQPPSPALAAEAGASGASGEEEEEEFDERASAADAPQSASSGGGRGRGRDHGHGRGGRGRSPPRLELSENALSHNIEEVRGELLGVNAHTVVRRQLHRSHSTIGPSRVRGLLRSKTAAPGAFDNALECALKAMRSAAATTAATTAATASALSQ